LSYLNESSITSLLVRRAFEPQQLSKNVLANGKVRNADGSESAEFIFTRAAE
jgi:hypothetical protein